MHIDIKKLKIALIMYLGTAIRNGNPVAVIDLSYVETDDENTIIAVAEEYDFDLDEYLVEN